MLKLFTPIILLLSLNLQAQIKVVPGGNVGIGEPAPDPSIKVTILTGNQVALSTKVVQTADWGWAQISNVNRATTKSWVVCDATGTHNFFVQGDGYVRSRGTILTSDARFKSNIEDLSIHNKLFLLQGKSYMFNQFQGLAYNPSDSKTEYGFVAQDVQKIFPDLVFSDEKGYLGINYTAFIPMLVEVVKEQQIKINQLDSLVNAYNNASNNAEVVSTPAWLGQNTPNPFNTSTVIKFFVPEKSKAVIINIYNLSGSQLKTYTITEKGNHSLFINAGELNAGIYIYNLIIDGKEISSKRMILTN